MRRFEIRATDDALDDLRRRLRSTRFPERECVEDWSQGVPLSYMKELCAFWADGYDWRVREARLNRFAHFKADLDGLSIHFIHAPSPHAGALPLLLSHGWPGSIVEFHKVIEPLCDPTRFGGNAADAFHVICPSLPGYGFSDKPARSGVGVPRIAKMFMQLMTQLGYSRYVAQGGDWGAAVATALAIADPEHCAGIHLNMPLVLPDPATLNDLTPAEQAALGAIEHHQRWGSGYSKQQSTRPQTLGYGLTDSPAGQAAWILEKFWAWTDSNGHPENVLTREELLDNVMLYWLPATAASSARLYWESYAKWATEPVRVPVGCSIFPKEIYRVSRRWAAKRYENLAYFNEVERGGHFAAFEQPELFVRELRDCFRLLRP